MVLDGSEVRYGALERAEVVDGRLRIRYTADGAKALGVDRDCEFALPGPREHEAVQAALARLFVSG